MFFPMYLPPSLVNAQGSLFTVELLLRIAAAGPRAYFCAAHTAWNWFDTMIVISALRLADNWLAGRKTGCLW